MKNKIFVVLGNHLFNPNFFSQYKNDHIFYMAEDLGLCTYEKHHKQKILLFLSSMRSFCDELKEKNFEVIYKKIEENDFELDYLEKLKIIITEKKIETVSVFEIEDKPFESTFLSDLKDFLLRMIQQSYGIDYAYNQFDIILSSQRPQLEFLFRL